MRSTGEGWSATRLIRRLHALFVSRHEAVPRLQPLFNLGVVNLEEQRALLGLRVHLPRHAVARPPDLDRLTRLDPVLGPAATTAGLILYCARQLTGVE